MANFVTLLPGGSDWLEKRQLVKEPLPPAVHAALTDWLAEGDATRSHPVLTFDEIITYMATGRVTRRLSIALGDIGYTRKELDLCKAEGETALDIAREVLARGVKKDTD
jgi:hypothetical protein